MTQKVQVKQKLSYNSQKIKRTKIGEKGLSVLNISGYLSMLFSGALIVVILASLVTLVSTPVAKEVKATGKHYSVHIVAGQSNAVGHGTNSTVNFQSMPEDNSIKFFYDSGYGAISTSNGQFTILGPQSRQYGSNFFGPEITLGRQLKNNGVENVAIIKIAKGITSIMGDWNATTQGPMYVSLKSNVQIALNQIIGQGDTYSIDGFHWMQGESDSSGLSATWYDYNLRNFISGVRRDLGVPDMPFIIGRINCPNCEPGPREQVRSTQVAVGDSVEFTRWFDTDQAELSTDNLHYNNNGVYSLGNSFFSKVWPFMQAKYPELMPRSGYTDVPASAPYSNAVDYVKYRNIMKGYRDNTFRPSNNVNRATMAQNFWRMAGSPNPTANYSYSDVPAGASYKKAIDWCRQRGIIQGYSDGTFRPTHLVSRKQFIQYLWKMSGKKPATALSSFLDVPASAKYKPAVDWAVQQGIIKIPSNKLLSPNDPVNRRFTSVSLYNLATNEQAWMNRNNAPSTVLF